MNDLRVALNYDQIRQYKPIPQPAKKSDSRFKSYQERTGLDLSWELDALEPSVMNNLITTAIEDIKDDAVWKQGCDAEKMWRRELRSAAEQWDIIGEELRQW